MKMSQGPFGSWRVEPPQSHYKRLVILLCLLALTGFIFTLTYCDRLSANFSLFEYKFKGIKHHKKGNILVASLKERPGHTNVFRKPVEVNDDSEEGLGDVVTKITKTYKEDTIDNTIVNSEDVSEDEAKEISWNDTRLDILHIKHHKKGKILIASLKERPGHTNVFRKPVEVYDDSEEGLGDVVTKTNTYKEDTIDNTIANSTDVSEEEALEISWNDTRLDILHMPKLQFDRRFKNPCWYEPLRSQHPYKNNTIILYSPSAKKTLKHLTEIWETVYEADDEPERLRCLPYFMIIGQPKCGSTNLFWKIVKHPDIDHPPIKELHWWTRGRQGRRFSNTKITPFGDYVDMFDRPALEIHDRFTNISETEESLQSKQYQIITGEASVSLFWDNHDWMKFPENAKQPEPLFIIPHYIHHIIPDVKLILMLREPSERMYSDYLYFHADSKSADDFHTSVVNAITLYTNCIKLRGPRACVYDTNLSYKVRVRLRIGMYSVYLKDWFSVFSESQFHVLRLEDYSMDEVKHLRQVYSFLGQRPLSDTEEETLFEDEIANARRVSDRKLGGMHNKTRQLLQTFYHPYNLDLSAMLQDKRFLWTDFIL